jgi:carbamoyltransferase
VFNPFLGKCYDVLNILEKYEGVLKIEKLGDRLYSTAAKSIADGKIIAWFQDGSECGPRALGNRSILADPRRIDMKDILNNKVKHRENFRPFAPAVLSEYQKIYFKLDISTPYMLMVADVVEEYKDKIPSVVHVDGTARLQTVEREMMPKFHKLISEFYIITKIPMVINTSFNVKGESIVETPEDAIKCFLKTQIDELYLDDFIISK